MVLECGGVGGEVAVEQVGDRGLAGHRGLLVEHSRLVHALVVEAGDLLRLAVFEDSEVVGSETFDDLTGLLVAHHHVGQHNVGLHLQREGAIGGLLLGKAGRGCTDDHHYRRYRYCRSPHISSIFLRKT